MSIYDDFKPYIDGNGLLAPAPAPVPPGVQKGSDNGPMFTSEATLILYKNGDYLHCVVRYLLIRSCIDTNGLLNRVPITQTDDQEGPDDYYGVLNASREIGDIDIPRAFLKAVWKYKGFLNNVNSGVKTWQSFLIRQPQLLACMINAAYPSLLNPLHWGIRLLAFPLYLYSATIIATSCMLSTVSDSNSRRLAWHVQNNLKKNSLLCWLASKVWTRRLYRDYPNGMNDVAGLYYYPQGTGNNPYSKYWVT